MSDTEDLGVLYTEHSRLTKATPIASLWSYETCTRGRDRRSVVMNANGNCEYWLERSDPLLNSILPGTGVSLIVNLGDPWAAGRSLVASSLLPRACVVGPVTQPRILRTGRCVRAAGAAFSPALAPDVFGVPACDLVDSIVPLEDVWSRDDVGRMLTALSGLEIQRCVPLLRAEMLARTGGRRAVDVIGRTAPRMIKLHGGRVSIDALARAHGVNRQQFARRFRAAAGLPPKLFARLTRFQALVQTLLVTNSSEWASVSHDMGFYDQAHMINEFHAFAGSPPTVFFQRPAARSTWTLT
jgi:AraC-like DNA-binding protein